MCTIVMLPGRGIGSAGVVGAGSVGGGIGSVRRILSADRGWKQSTKMIIFVSFLSCLPRIKINK